MGRWENGEFGALVESPQHIVPFSRELPAPVTSTANWSKRIQKICALLSWLQPNTLVNQLLYSREIVTL